MDSQVRDAEDWEHYYLLYNYYMGVICAQDAGFLWRFRYLQSIPHQGPIPYVGIRSPTPVPLMEGSHICKELTVMGLIMTAG